MRALLALLAFAIVQAAPSPALLQLMRLSPEPRLAPPPRVMPRAVAGPLFSDTLWGRLEAPAPETARALAGVLPWLKPEALRQLDLDETELLFGEAANRDLDLLDLFTDAGLRGGLAYYVPGAVLAVVDGRFQLPLLYPVSGTDGDGRPFHMIGIVMGLGHADVLYGQGPFEYDTPWFPDYRYIAEARVGQTILGDGALAVEGLSVSTILTPRIISFIKISPTQAQVKTSVLTKVVALRRIERR